VNRKYANISLIPFWLQFWIAYGKQKWSEEDMEVRDLGGSA